jgi:hypothetical protein
MKYLLLILLVLSITAGCSKDNERSASVTNNTNSVKSAEKQEITSNEHDKGINKKTSKNNPQAPDTRPLQTIGQTFEDEDGILTLKSISNHNQKHIVGPVELTIKDVKVMNYSPSPDLIDYFHGFTQDETNFNYVKFHVTVTNTANKAIDFAPISFFETNAGEKKDFEDDFYLESLYGKFSPNEVKTGEMGFVLGKTDPADLKSITLTTSDLFGEDNKLLHEGKEVKIKF